MSTYLTPTEVAEVLRVHRTTIYTWIRQGKIPFLRLPSGDVRISQRELDKWLTTRQRAAR